MISPHVIRTDIAAWHLLYTSLLSCPSVTYPPSTLAQRMACAANDIIHLLLFIITLRRLCCSLIPFLDHRRCPRRLVYRRPVPLRLLPAPTATPTRPRMHRTCVIVLITILKFRLSARIHRQQNRHTREMWQAREQWL